jgi:uncharacterized protein
MLKTSNNQLSNETHSCIMRKMYITLKFELRKLCVEHNIPDDHGYYHAITVADNAEMSLNSIHKSCVNSYYKIYYYHILIAALLHDIDDRKVFPNNKNYENAQMLLGKVGASDNDKSIIIKMISLVSASNNGNSDSLNDKWLYIPRDADRIEAIGKIGIKRVIDFSMRHSHYIVTSETPLVLNDEELGKLDLLGRYKKYVELGGGSQSMLDHIYDKLLNISTMSSNNAYLSSIATERHNIMKEYVFKLCKLILDKGYLNIEYKDIIDI